MPGVPSGRGCEGCRKQKKKCDQAKPTCSRCTRLGLACVGAGQQRYKFMEQQPSRKQAANGHSELALRKSQKHNNVMTIQYLPSNKTTQLASAYVHIVQPATDLRYNLAWSYGPYLIHLPQRIGKSAALDAAAAALMDVHSNYCLARPRTSENIVKFNLAVRELRMSLEDPIEAISAETLCAINLIMQCQIILGLVDGVSTGHVEGMVQLLRARKFQRNSGSFESALLATMGASVMFEALLSNTIQMSHDEWKKIAYLPSNCGSDEAKMFQAICLVAYLLGRRAQNVIVPHEEDQILGEITATYQIFKPRLVQMKADWVEMMDKPFSALLRWENAAVMRAYGFLLGIAIILNLVQRALGAETSELVAEAEAYAFDIVVICKLALSMQPFGATYIPFLSSLAYCGSTDPSLKASVTDILGEYFNSSWGDAIKLAPGCLDWVYRRLRYLEMKPYPKGVSETSIANRERPGSPEYMKPT